MTVPPEIILCIFELAFAPATSESSIHRLYRELQVCALVSKAWASIAQSILFRHVEIYSAARLESFAQIVKRSESRAIWLASKVQSLRLREAVGPQLTVEGVLDLLQALLRCTRLRMDNGLRTSSLVSHTTRGSLSSMSLADIHIENVSNNTSNWDATLLLLENIPATTSSVIMYDHDAAGYGLPYPICLSKLRLRQFIFHCPYFNLHHTLAEQMLFALSGSIGYLEVLSFDLPGWVPSVMDELVTTMAPTLRSFALITNDETDLLSPTALAACQHLEQFVTNLYPWNLIEYFPITLQRLQVGPIVPFVQLERRAESVRRLWDAVQRLPDLKSVYLDYYYDPMNPFPKQELMEFRQSCEERGITVEDSSTTDGTKRSAYYLGIWDCR